MVLSGAGTETHPNSAASTSADIDGVFDTGCPADVVGGQGPGGQRRDRIHGDSNDIDSYQFDSTVVQTDVDGEALSFPAVLPDDAGSAEGRGHMSESRDRGGADRTDVDGETLSSPAALPDDAGSVDGGGHKSVFHATVVFAGLVPRLLHDSLARAGFHIEERVHGEVDLGAIETQRDSEHLALSPGVVLFFAVALCSTVSRARDRRVPRRLVARGVPELPRLRSDDAPHGLPNLLVASPRDILRVRQDNAIAQFFGSLSLLLTSRGVAWALENPRRSYL